MTRDSGAGRQRPSPVLFALACAAPVAWIMMMATGFAATLVANRVHGWDRATIDELMVAFLVSMALPFLIVIAAVYLPVVVAMQRAARPGVPIALFAAAGAVAAPFGGLLLLVLGHLVFAGSANAPDSLSADLGRMVGPGFALLLPALSALVLGGAVFGAGFAKGWRYAERNFPPG